MAIEACSFIAISIQNYIVYGHVWEGGRVKYDPHAIFLLRDSPRQTDNNRTSQQTGKTHRVWIFGGSTARGWGTDYKTTIPSLLAGRLNMQAGTIRYQFTNYGQDAFNSLLESKYF